MKKYSLIAVILVFVIIFASCGINQKTEITSAEETETVTEEVFTSDVSENTETTIETTVTTTKVPETDKIENVTTKEYSTDLWGKVHPAKFEVENKIMCSSDGGATYGNLKKEFPSNKECYVRISNKVISNGAGKDDVVYVTYRFSGENYSVKLSEGIATRTENEDNTIVYIQEIVAAKEKKADENIVVFQLTPLGEGNAKVNVSFGDNVDSKYDKSNEIYFKNITNE